MRLQKIFEFNETCIFHSSALLPIQKVGTRILRGILTNKEGNFASCKRKAKPLLINVANTALDSFIRFSLFTTALWPPISFFNVQRICTINFIMS